MAITCRQPWNFVGNQRPPSELERDNHSRSFLNPVEVAIKVQNAKSCTCSDLNTYVGSFSALSDSFVFFSEFHISSVFVAFSSKKALMLKHVFLLFLR